MKVINLFGQPGAGKSTTAAGLFFEMKSNGYNCELVNEYAKEMVWKKSHPDSFNDQLYIFAKQNAKLERLRGQVDFVITDCPLLLSNFYTPLCYYDNFRELIFTIWNSYDNINFNIKRTKTYNPTGRLQTERESDQIGEDLEFMLDNNNIQYYSIDGDKTAPRKIYETLNSGHLE